MRFINSRGPPFGPMGREEIGMPTEASRTAQGPPPLRRPRDRRDKKQVQLSPGRKPNQADFASTPWLGWLDSNQRMRESKSRALPLGYTPMWKYGQGRSGRPGPQPQYGVGNGARTHDTRNHNPVLCQLSYTHHIQFWRWRIRLKLGKETRRSERTLPSAGGRAMRGLRRRRGTPEGTRTPGPLLRRQLLYPPELQAHILRFAGTPQKRPSVSARDKDCGKADGLSRLRRSERYAACAGVERVMGIEPTRPAWKAGILPLNYTRVMGASANISFAMIAQSLRLCQSLP